MKCRADKGQIVIPIFYDVEPTEVRKQIGEFGEAFAKLTKKTVWRKLFAKREVENITKSESWRKALVDASNISGFEPKNVANGHEAIVIKKIVDTIFNTLFPLDCDDEKLVGIRGRVKSLISQLQLGSNGVRMVGIWGVGGGGKTTLATSVYKEISHLFGGHCLLENIREKASKNGLQKLQEDILSNVFKTEVKVHSVAEGRSKIKSMLCHRNVLLILDDVDNLDQLEALVGSHNWVGDGSRIIITTRDEHLLITHRVDEVFPVTLLSCEEGTWLFNSHAYNEEKQVTDYEKLSSRVVLYAAGLPLALKVLGSFLYDKDENEWMSTLARLQNIPQSDILKQLRISYDGLQTTEKEIFLDIACFFRGWGWRRSNHVKEILDACGFHPDIGVKVLIEKALITINSNGKFDMHDLIQEMGHFIIRGEHPDNPEKHSRVWKIQEINNMCIGDATTENDKIEAFVYYDYERLYKVPIPSQFIKFVSNLKKLRWIWVDASFLNIVEGPNFLSNELRYINWEHYPASPFPDSFQPMNLVVLKMTLSLQKELWRSHKRLPQLKVLRLISMRKLVSTPKFDGLPCLEELELCQCNHLQEIHPSIGRHRSLKYVLVSGCPNLRMFPTILKMEKLERLIIDSCHESLEFPEIQANMESLKKLSLNGIGIEGLLSSIGERCTSLISLRLEDGEIPSAFGEMSNLQELNLKNNNFSKLHFSISQLTRLKFLNLSHCKRLLELPQLPSSIAILLANKCDSLTDVGDFYVDCKRLWYASLTCSNMVIDSNRFLQFMLEGGTAENHCVTLILQGLEIPKGFTPCLRDGSKYTLQLPENWCSDFCGFLMCAVLRNDFLFMPYQRITMEQVMTDGSMGTDSEDDDVIWKESVGDEITYLWYIPFASLRHTEWWDCTYKKVSFFADILTMHSNRRLSHPCSGFGVRVVERKGGSGPTETSADSYGISDDYTTGFKIHHDSSNHLDIEPRIYD